MLGLYDLESLTRRFCRCRGRCRGRRELRAPRGMNALPIWSSKEALEAETSFHALLVWTEGVLVPACSLASSSAWTEDLTRWTN